MAFVLSGNSTKNAFLMYYIFSQRWLCSPGFSAKKNLKVLNEVGNIKCLTFIYKAMVIFERQSVHCLSLHSNVVGMLYCFNLL